jgi:hypothetical protein
MPQAGSRVTNFDFNDLDVSVMQHSERVTGFDFNELYVDVMQHPERVTGFDFDDLDAGVMQHSPRVTSFQFDHTQRPSEVDDRQFDNPGDSRLHFGNLDVQSLHRITDFHIEKLGGDTYPALLPFLAQDVVGGMQG